MIKLFLLVFVTLSLSKSYAQKTASVKIIKATQQSWSGGIAGMHGEKFYVEFQVGKSLTPDTLHLSGYDVPIILFSKSNYAQPNCTREVKGNIATYKLNVNYSFPNEYEMQNGNANDFLKQKKYSCNYELIFKNKAAYCILTYEALPPLAYP